MLVPAHGIRAPTALFTEIRYVFDLASAKRAIPVRVKQCPVIELIGFFLSHYGQ
jgi:hypothetical protein